MFVSAFLAGSIVPANSELVMSALLAVGSKPWLLILFASLGNILGGLTCYWLGHLGNRQWIIKYMRVKPEKLAKVEKFLEGKGAWLAFLVIVPFIGDIIIVVFGLMRANLLIVTFSMSIGKVAKYIVWMYATMGVLGIFS